jgi:hypothetical protein
VTATPGQAAREPDPWRDDLRVEQAAQAASPLLCDNREVMDGLMAAMGNPERFVPRAPMESYSSWQRRAIVEHIAPLIIAHAAAQEPHAAPGLRAALVDAMLRWSGRDAFDQCASDLARILDQHPEPQPAPELAAAMRESRLRAEVITEILDAFSPSGSGHTARVGMVQIAKWRTRAGLTS